MGYHLSEQTNQKQGVIVHFPLVRINLRANFIHDIKNLNDFTAA